MTKSITPLGRFAPSPTGQLHFGSMLTAVASYCHIKSIHGSWLVRIEDTDHQRCKAEFSDAIIRCLSAYGMHSDEEVRYQSKYLDFYAQALDTLDVNSLIYACQCSRKSIQHYLNNHPDLPRHRYPEICRNLGLNISASANNHTRLKTVATDYEFHDIIQGQQSLNAYHLTGDMILRRHDGIYNYILTSAVDDLAQNITHIIRGLDLLELTPAQAYIRHNLNHQTNHAKNPTVSYGHLPLAYNYLGQKLSKQNKAEPIAYDNEQQISQTLQKIFLVLKQPSVTLDTPEKMLAQAISNWTVAELHGRKKVAQPIKGNKH